MVISDIFPCKKEFGLAVDLISCKYTLYDVGCEFFTEATKIIREADGDFVGTDVGLQCIIFYKDDKQFLKAIRKMDRLIDTYRLKLIKERLRRKCKEL